MLKPFLGSLNFWLTYFIILFFNLACKQSGLPCDYDIKEVQAEVVSIETAANEGSTQLYKIMLRFNESSLAKQPQSLEDLVPRIKGKVNDEFVSINKIKKGDIYNGTVSEISSGDCQPLYVSFNYYFKTP